MAERDVPAVIDKMLAATGQDKIYLVGHSMGTTILTAFLSENHDYDDKVSLDLRGLIQSHFRSLSFGLVPASFSTVPGADAHAHCAGADIRGRYCSHSENAFRFRSRNPSSVSTWRKFHRLTAPVFLIVCALRHTMDWRTASWVEGFSPIVSTSPSSTPSSASALWLHRTSYSTLCLSTSKLRFAGSHPLSALFSSTSHSNGAC